MHTAFRHSGGIAAFLADVGGNAIYNARDYICDIQPCPNPKFVIHNSRSQSITVTASSDLGPGLTLPAPFTLAPGALKVVEFKFTPGFDISTARADAGNFTFTGKTGASTVAVTKVRAFSIGAGLRRPISPRR